MTFLDKDSLSKKVIPLCSLHFIIGQKDNGVLIRIVNNVHSFGTEDALFSNHNNQPLVSLEFNNKSSYNTTKVS